MPPLFFFQRVHGMGILTLSVFQAQKTRAIPGLLLVTLNRPKSNLFAGISDTLKRAPLVQTPKKMQAFSGKRRQ
jgi:hypothetical protein